MSQSTGERDGGVRAAIEADWVIYGKTDGSSADYGVLRSSSRYFNRVDFGTILRRFSPGTPPARAKGPSADGLPWATISYAPRREPATSPNRSATGRRRSATAGNRPVDGRGASTAGVGAPDGPLGPVGPGVLGIAVYGWTDLADVVGRPIIQTTYVCAPFEELAAVPIGYLDLYNAVTQGRDVARAVGPDAIRVARGAPAPLGGRVPPDLPVPAGRVPAGGSAPADGSVWLRQLPSLGPGDVAQYLDADNGARFQLAARVAALLLCQPVALIGQRPSGPETRVPDRLRFFDAVAALLPYGQRARLVASTWADAGLAHHIRLAYTDRPRQGDAVVRMPTDDRPAGVPALPAAAKDYYELLLQLRQDERIPAEAIVTHLQEPAYRLAHAVDDPRHALLSLSDRGAPAVFAARLVPSRARELDDRAKAEPAPALRATLLEQAAAAEVEHAVHLLRAQRRLGRLLAGAGSVDRDDAALAALAAPGGRGAAVTWELILRAVDDDLAAVAAGYAAAPGEPDPGTAAPAATAHVRSWLAWVAGTPTLAARLTAFAQAVDGRPDPRVFTRLAVGVPADRRAGLALLRVARLAGCSRLLNEAVWLLVMRNYYTHVLGRPTVAGQSANPCAWSKEDRAAWAREIADLPTTLPEGLDDARLDVARILLGAPPVYSLHDRMSALYYRSYRSNVVLAVREILDHHGPGGLAEVERVMDGLAGSLDRDHWPGGPAARDTLELLWLVTETVPGGHVSPRLRRTVTAFLKYPGRPELLGDDEERRWWSLMRKYRT